MDNMVQMSNYDRLHTDKAWGNFWKFDNSNNKRKTKNNVRSTWGPFTGQEKPKNSPLWNKFTLQ